MTTLPQDVQSFLDWYQGWCEFVKERPENARSPTPKEFARLDERIMKLGQALTKAPAVQVPIAPALAAAAAKQGIDKFDQPGVKVIEPRLTKGQAMSAGP